MQLCMDEYGGLVWSLARRYCPLLSEAEDGVQEVFIALWESAGRFDPSKGSESTFVATVARRRLIDRARSRTRRDRATAEAREEIVRDSAPAIDEAELGEDARRAREALARLTPDQQRVLELAVTRGHTHEQIARMTDMPLGTVKTHARRGLMRIRALLEETGSDAPVSAKK